MSTHLGYNRIFVALDGQARQENVLRRAAIMAANEDAELFVGHVIDQTKLEAAGVLSDEKIAQFSSQFKEALEPLLAELKQELGVEPRSLMVLPGRIRETLALHMIEEVKPDLIVCGDRGLDNLNYAQLGSISTYLTRTFDIDTLIVK